MEIEKTFYTDELIRIGEKHWDLHDQAVLKHFNFLERYEVILNENSITISIIIIKENFRNKGYGTEILNKICWYADENKLQIQLTPTQYFGSDMNKLILFYKKFGFVENKGKNKINTLSHKMYRNARIV